MEFRHLRYFVAVAEEQHVTRAARRLGMQQPPLTQQIQALEAEIGVQLFERSPRQIRLNDAGRLFLEDARRLLSEADLAIERVRQHVNGASRVLRIGLTTSSAMHGRTRQLLNLFRAERPQATLQLEEGAAVDLLGALDRGALDIAFIRAPPPDVAGIASQWLADDDLVVAIPSVHPLATASSLRLLDLQAEDLVLYRQESCAGITKRLMTAFERTGVQPRVSAETRRLMSAVNMVAAGMGITVVPRSMEALHMDSVVYRPLATDADVRAPVNMVFRSVGTSAVLRDFLSMGERVALARG